MSPVTGSCESSGFMKGGEINFCYSRSQACVLNKQSLTTFGSISSRKYYVTPNQLLIYGLAKKKSALKSTQTENTNTGILLYVT
jgi:hypothetical protein